MEQIIPDTNKNYLEEEPFFITDAKTGEVHILRSKVAEENPVGTILGTTTTTTRN